MEPGTRRSLLLVGGMVVGYGLVLLASPARVSLGNGLQCLRRYQRVWLIPAAFAVAHAGLKFWLNYRAGVATSGAEPIVGIGSGWGAAARTDLLSASALPAAESTAAIFNCVVDAFPLSVPGAFLFLLNWGGCQRVVWRGLLRRGGVLVGSSAHVFLVLCAVAALCKPAAYYFLSNTGTALEAETVLRVGELINSFSFFFEYLLGVGVQVYLVLLAFAWIRGLTFRFSGLRRLALRRFVVVGKWSAVVLVLSSLGIHLPLILASFHLDAAPQSVAGFVLGTRWVLVTVLLTFCGMQVSLVLHNVSLRSALTDLIWLWRLHGWQVGWLMIVVALHFLLLAVVNTFLPQAFGRWTWCADVWSLLLYPLVWSAFAGWFLASWVCLFRRCEGQRLEHLEMAPLSA